MAEKGEALVAATVDPIELNDAALAFERQMSVPGTVGTQEGDESAVGRGDFACDVVDIVRGAKNTEAAAGIVPSGIQIEQDGDNFAGGVVVNLAIVGTAAAANRDSGRAAGEIQSKLFLEGFTKFFRLERVNHGLEAESEFNGIEGKAAGLRDGRIIGIDSAESLGLYELAKNEVLIGCAFKRRGAKSIEIEYILIHKR